MTCTEAASAAASTGQTAGILSASAAERRDPAAVAGCIGYLTIYRQHSSPRPV
jgi:hypothetical protein